MTEPESAVLNRYTTENVFASGDGNRHGCCTHLLATRPPKGKWRSGFSDARIGCCRRWRLGQGHKTPACPWLPRDAVWHSRLTTRTARCRLGPTPLGANIRYSKCASRLGHCAVSRADSAASRGSARRRKLNWLRGMGGEKRTVESARENALKSVLASSGLTLSSQSCQLPSKEGP